MKKLLLFLFILNCINIQGQKLEFKDLSLSDEHLYSIHLTAGYIVGYSSTAIYYGWTGKKTLSAILGTGTGILAGHLKEKYDVNQGRYYSRKDLFYTGIGAVAGAVTIRIVLGKYKRMKDLNNREMLQFGSYSAIL